MKTTKKSKQANGIERAARIIRGLPDTLNAQVQFEDADKPENLPYNPTGWWLLNAGAYVRGVMRLGGFKDYENQLLFADGEKAIWKELIRILRKRAGLIYPRDYLRDFRDDCNLVANELLVGLYSADITNGTWQQEVIGLIFAHRDWSAEKIGKVVGQSRKTIYADRHTGIAIRARNERKRVKNQPPPNGEIDTRTGRIEA